MSNTNIKWLTVHCAATKPSHNTDAKAIDRMHRQRGFLRIGYHYVIKRDGTVEAGRKETEVGAHTEGRNTGNIGICLAGGLNEQTGRAENNYTPAQFASLERLLHELKGRYPSAEVLGHRDHPNVAKDCPCFSVRNWWSDVNKT